MSTAGSRQIAATDLSKQDFAFPAGVPAAQKIQTTYAGSKSFVPFYTPMAIATWKPIVDLLTAAGVVHAAGGITSLDMAAYMRLVDKNTRWKDLPGNTTYAINKSILITSTDVRKSNSAAMYLALASYVANGDNIVENDGQAGALMDRLAPLFLCQGFLASEQQIRWSGEKAAALGSSALVGPGPMPEVSTLLILRSTASTRDLARKFEASLKTAYPARSSEVEESLRTGSPWPGPGIVWVRIEGERVELVDGPPRGVRLGR